MKKNVFMWHVKMFFHLTVTNKRFYANLETEKHPKKQQNRKKRCEPLINHMKTFKKPRKRSFLATVNQPHKNVFMCHIKTLF